MIGTAYEVACILVKVVYRVGKWLLVTPADIDAEPRLGKELSEPGPQRPARQPRLAVSASTSSAGVSERTARFVEPSADMPLRIDEADASPAGSAARLEGWQRAARIVTRDGPGYRVHFYFKSGGRSVRRVVMLDFPALRERFGADHAAAVRSRLGLGAKRPPGRTRMPEAKWGRLVLPDGSVDCASPFDLPALSMIDLTLSDVERFIGTTDLPAAKVVQPEASTVAPKAKARAKASKDVRSPASGGIGGTSAPVAPIPVGVADAVGEFVSEPSGSSRRRVVRSAAAESSVKASLVESGAQGLRPTVGTSAPRAGRSTGEKADKAVGRSVVADVATDRKPEAAESSEPAAVVPDGGAAPVDAPAARAPSAPWDVSDEEEGYGPKAFVGVLVESGLAERIALSSGRRFNSFFADLYSDGIVVRHTGSDLQRALKHVDARPGDRIELIFHGSVPLTGGKLRKKLWTAHVLGRSGTAGGS